MSGKSKLGEEESYHKAMEKLVCGEAKTYEPYAETNKNYTEMTVETPPSYVPEKNEIYVESMGPRGGEGYTLVFDLSNKQLIHDHGPYDGGVDDSQFASPVEDIRFPEE